MGSGRAAPAASGDGGQLMLDREREVGRRKCLYFLCQSNLSNLSNLKRELVFQLIRTGSLPPWLSSARARICIHFSEN